MEIVLPAHAGMIPTLHPPGFLTVCAPRACGDDPMQVKGVVTLS